jgi:hypothetical protein
MCCVLFFERPFMKQLLLTILAILVLSSAFSQQIISGDYDSGLKLSYASLLPAGLAPK